jgi:hypothetical protein
VQKVVPALTSKSAEIGLSMDGAKQHYDTGFILVLVVGLCPARVRSWRCIARHCGARIGELQARWERRRSLQVPEG